MRKSLICGVLVVGMAAPVVLGNVQNARTTTAPVTFSETISPIIFKNCTTCHHTGEAVPFTLMSYEDVVKRGRTIVAVTERRYMPPWHAASEMGHFRDER